MLISVLSMLSSLGVLEEGGGGGGATGLAKQAVAFPRVLAI